VIDGNVFRGVTERWRLERTGPHRFGVNPDLVGLDNGVMALFFGRPGVYLSFSTDGTGRQWTDPLPILPGDQKRLLAKTDGYTAMVKLNANQILLAYTDFEHKDADGRQRKAILVRGLTVKCETKAE